MHKNKLVDRGKQNIVIRIPRRTRQCFGMKSGSRVVFANAYISNVKNLELGDLDRNIVVFSVTLLPAIFGDNCLVADVREGSVPVLGSSGSS